MAISSQFAWRQQGPFLSGTFNGQSNIRKILLLWSFYLYSLFPFFLAGQTSVSIKGRLRVPLREEWGDCCFSCSKLSKEAKRLVIQLGDVVLNLDTSARQQAVLCLARFSLDKVSREARPHAKLVFIQRRMQKASQPWPRDPRLQGARFAVIMNDSCRDESLPGCSLGLRCMRAFFFNVQRPLLFWPGASAISLIEA